MIYRIPKSVRTSVSRNAAGEVSVPLRNARSLPKRMSASTVRSEHFFVNTVSTVSR